MHTPIFFLTTCKQRAILYTIKYDETVDAEITVGMIPQRVRGAESRMEVQTIKWTAEGTVKCERIRRVFCNVKRHTLVAWGMKVPVKRMTVYVIKQGGTADSMIIRPWQRRNLCQGFLFIWR